MFPVHENRVWKRHTFSPLQLLFWTCLFTSVRGQLKEPFPAQFELSSLDGTNGFVINGERAGDYSGFAVSNAGDFNGDGLDDLLIGAHHASPLAMTSAGAAYLIYGFSDIGSNGVFDLNRLNGRNGFVLYGENIDDQSGYAVSSVGDVNGDGLEDILIGAVNADPSDNSKAGKSYVIFGGKSVGSSGSVELSSFNRTQGYVFNGVDSGDQIGSAVSGAGDVNQDGLADILIGAYEAAPDGNLDAGKTYIVFGGMGLGDKGSVELSKLKDPNGFVIHGEQNDDRSGFSVSSAGDVNGDGIDDFLIGAYRADPLGKAKAGKTYVIFGSKNFGSTNPLYLSTLNGKTGFVLVGEDAGDRSGISVSSAGDVNGDGMADILIGAYAVSPSDRSVAGRTYVIFGEKGLGRNGRLELSNLNGTNGFVLNGVDADDKSGYAVSCAGDVNGDGIADIMIGARFASPSGRMEAGKTYIVFGRKGMGKSSVFELSTLDGKIGFVLNGETEGDHSGFSVSGAGDVNGDGADDLIIGSHDASPVNKIQAGKTYVVFGRNSKQSVAGSTSDPLLNRSPSITQNPTSDNSLFSSLQTIASFKELMSVKTRIPLDSFQRPEMMQDTQATWQRYSMEGLENRDITGIIAAVSALFCLIISGGVVLCFKKKNKNQAKENHKEKDVRSLDQMQTSQQNHDVYLAVDTFASQQQPNEYGKVEFPSIDTNYESVFSRLEE